MDPCYMLDESIILSDRLLSLLNDDRDGIRDCLEGELLDEYLISANKAEERIKSIRQRLLQVRIEQQELIFLNRSTI